MSAPTGFASRWETVRGLRLHALVSNGAGAAPTVVLLPGLVTASRSMVPLARALTRHGLRVWVLDLPGFGYSDKPERSLSLADQAGFVADWLRVTGCAPARVLGNSFGSQLTAALAAAHPDVVERVVLLAPTAGPRVRRLLSWLRVLPGPTGARNRPTGRWRSRLLARLHDALGRVWHDGPPLRVLNVVEYACASLPRAVSSARCAVLEQLEQALPRIGVPVLIVRADRDHLSSLDWAQQLPGLTPRARLVRLPGLGHAAFHGAPEVVAGVTAPFLSAATDR